MFLNWYAINKFEYNKNFLQNVFVLIFMILGGDPVVQASEIYGWIRFWYCWFNLLWIKCSIMLNWFGSWSQVNDWNIPESVVAALVVVARTASLVVPSGTGSCICCLTFWFSHSARNSWKNNYNRTKNTIFWPCRHLRNPVRWWPSIARTIASRCSCRRRNWRCWIRSFCLRSSFCARSRPGSPNNSSRFRRRFCSTCRCRFLSL